MVQKYSLLGYKVEVTNTEPEVSQGTRIATASERSELGFDAAATGEVRYRDVPVNSANLPSETRQIASRDAHVENLEAKNFEGNDHKDSRVEKPKMGLSKQSIADPAEGDEPWVLRDLTGGDPNDDPAESNHRQVQIAQQNDAALELVSGQEPPIDPNDHDSLQLVGRYKDYEEDDSSQTGSLWKRFWARLGRSR